jgi:Na+/proline symporter
MSLIDWIVMAGTLALVVLYGMSKASGADNLDGHVRGSNGLTWPTIGLSVMATQASAITF